jgi:integrase
MAVRMARKRSVIEVQAQLGHSSLAVTTVYLAHLDARQLAEAMAEV